MITVNMDKAKAIGHDVRRAARAEEFKPLDDVIMKQIPNTDVQAIEAQRQEIRDKYATMQAEIEAATNAGEIKTALGI